MKNLSIFNNMTSDEINMVLKGVGARKIAFRKDHIILSNLFENDLVGIVLSGSAIVIKYDYFGNREILDHLEYNSMFGKPFSYMDNDISVVATTDCEVLFFDYDNLTNNRVQYDKITNNINDILSIKIAKLYERVEILSKRTIREKLLCYFSLINKEKGKKTFILPVTYIELADYLSVDRSAMMRELKKLKDTKVISTNGKKITIN